MTLKHKTVSYKGKKYTVMEVKCKDEMKPVLLDYSDFKYINKLNKTWKCTSSNFISCNHSVDDTRKEIFIHDVVMALIHRDKKTAREHHPIVHINNNGLDNRRVNLMYDSNNKDKNKNFKKKKRTIDLPTSSGIKASELPTYVWYLKPNGSHGERFTVEVGDYKWKTTSSKTRSLRYKLEEAKAYLRNLKDSNPQLFDEYCMNGEYTKEGKDLMCSFNKIIEKCGYKPLKVSIDGLTDKYIGHSLKKLTQDERSKLKEFKKKLEE